MKNSKLFLISLVIIGTIIFLGSNIQKVLPTVLGLISNIRGDNRKQSYIETKSEDLNTKKDKLLNKELKNIILSSFSYFSQNLRDNDSFKVVLKDQNCQPSQIELKNLIRAELRRDASDNDQWTNWQWSPQVLSLLEEAVNRRMCMLSGFSALELIKLTERFPNSLLTKGSIEYRNLTDGASYFGGSTQASSSSILRQPFSPNEEKNIWLQFIDNYPDHPGTDDAMFRIARSYEVLGDYQTAILWYYKTSQAPDGAMQGACNRRISLLANSIMSSQEVSLLIDRINKSDDKLPKNLIPYLQYSKAYNLVNEGKLQDGYDALSSFIQTYKQKESQALIRAYNLNISSDSNFWNSLEKHVEDIKELQRLRDQPTANTDQTHHKTTYRKGSKQMPQ
jgi:hypothetical protein